MKSNNEEARPAKKGKSNTPAQLPTPEPMTGTSNSPQPIISATPLSQLALANAIVISKLPTVRSTTFRPGRNAANAPPTVLDIDSNSKVTPNLTANYEAALAHERDEVRPYPYVCTHCSNKDRPGGPHQDCIVLQASFSVPARIAKSTTNPRDAHFTMVRCIG